jgi:flagellar hook-length control protein FliK
MVEPLASAAARERSIEPSEGQAPPLSLVQELPGELETELEPPATPARGPELGPTASNSELEVRAAAERPAAVGPSEPRGGPSEAPAPVRTNPYATADSAPAEQVARGLRVSLSPQGDRVTVRLEPASLGKVEIVLAKGEEGVAAHFRVETPQAQQALVSEAPLLRQALESRGIPLVEVFVDLNDSPRGRGEAGGGRKAPGRRPQHAELAAAEEARPPPGFAGSWGIDTRV